MLELIHGNPKRVLEIGCGAGCFRANFHGDLEYWGVEPCPSAAMQARKTLTHVLEGTYDNVSNAIPDHHFDLIVCNDVIEHMPDPMGFLCEVRHKLVDDGSMILSVPNLRNAVTLYNLLVKGDFHYVDAGVLDYTHLHLFTKKSIMRMAEDCGWHIDICKPLPPQPFKFFKNIILNCAMIFIPEIKSLQIAARLRVEGVS